MFACLETFFGIGLIVGPTVGGALYSVGGYTLPFAALGTLLIGMISHKKLLITVFGHKHKIKNFIKKFDIFHGKISKAFGFWFIFGIKLLILKQNHIKMINEF